MATAGGKTPGEVASGIVLGHPGTLAQTAGEARRGPLAGFSDEIQVG